MRLLKVKLMSPLENLAENKKKLKSKYKLKKTNQTLFLKGKNNQMVQSKAL